MIRGQSERIGDDYGRLRFEYVTNRLAAEHSALGGGVGRGSGVRRLKGESPGGSPGETPGEPKGDTERHHRWPWCRPRVAGEPAWAPPAAGPTIQAVFRRIPFLTALEGMRLHGLSGRLVPHFHANARYAMSDVLLPPPDSLSDQIRQRLPRFGAVHWVTQTGSTNADLLERARQRPGGRVRDGGAGTGARPFDAAPADLAHPAAWARQESGVRPWLLGAHLQNTGRGRAGRPWQNRPGQALMFSCAFDTTLAAADLPALSPLAGLAATEALRGLAGARADGLRVKWPNDVMFGEGKLSGVLVETTRNPVDRAAGHIVVIGMGTNLVDAELLSRELQRPIADWAGVGAPVPVAEVVATVARAWQDAVAQLEAEGFLAFIERYARVDALAGRTVRVLDRGEVLQTGEAIGTDRQGRLLVRTEAGVSPVSVGEISVRAA